MQVHTDFAGYRPEAFHPYRLGALLLKAIRLEYADYPLWHHNEYEYETERLAIDLLSGGTFLREWVDNPAAQPSDFDARLTAERARLGRHPPAVPDVLVRTGPLPPSPPNAEASGYGRVSLRDEARHGGRQFSIHLAQTMT